MKNIFDATSAMYPKLIIATSGSDIHAIAVSEAYKSIGGESLVWVSSDLSHVQGASISINDGIGVEVSIESRTLSIRLNSVDSSKVLWNRRRPERLDVCGLVHPSDAAISERELLRFLDCISSVLNDEVRCINDIAAARRAENKSLQLKVAHRAGLAVPRTCITNQISAARDFLNSSGGRCIVKPLRGAMWRSGDETFVTYTAFLNIADLEESLSLQHSPVIIQDYIEKSFEVRVVALNKTFVAVSLDSQIDERSSLDWRAVSAERLNVKPITLPESVQASCLAVMSELGLVFGCFDFVINKSGDWVFLEVNQMGQFLWIEQANPEIPILDIFVQFISTPENVRPIRARNIYFQAVAAEAYDRLRREKPFHASVQSPGFVTE